MVQDKVKLKVNTQISKFVDVSGGSHLLIDTVIDHREAPVQIRIEDAGKNIEGLEYILELISGKY